MSSADLIALIKKQPIGFGCAAVSVCLALLLYFRSGKVAESQATFDAKSAEAALILSNVRNSANLAEQVAEIQTLTKELDGRLVRAGQLAINQQYFYKLEAENEVKLLDVRQGTLPKATKSLYTGVPYSVSVQGSYKQVLDFLQRLENGSHFCRFNSVVFSKVAASGDDAVQGPTNMSLTLNLELLGVP